jgi:hypothetical protein
VTSIAADDLLPDQISCQQPGVLDAATAKTNPFTGSQVINWVNSTTHGNDNAVTLYIFL